MTNPTLSYPIVRLATLADTVIVPDPSDTDLFIPWLTRLYEDIALAVNQKDWLSFTIPIGQMSTPTVIPNIPNQGAFILIVAGTLDGMPAGVYSLIKSISTQAGAQPIIIQKQTGVTFNGNTAWNGVDIRVSNADANNWTISHNAADATLVGNFNIRVVGTT